MTTLLWQNDATHQVTANFLQGTMFQTWGWMSQGGIPGWNIVGFADIDGDGYPDLIWQDETTRKVTVNFYNGTTFIGWAWMEPTDVPGWRVVGVADVNGDGHPDLIWQNETTRQVTVNYFNGATFTGWAWMNPYGIPGWKVVAVADFNGDGSPDLIWQNDTTRQVTVNFYQGTTLTGAAWLNNGGIPGWHVAGALDMNGDRVPDLVWLNDTTRQATVNFYGGPSRTLYQGWAWLYSSGIPGWSIVALVGPPPPPPAPTLPGIQTGPAPWPPELNFLPQRLTMDGLPIPSAEGSAFHIHQHLDIFVNGNPVQVPAFIGIIQATGFFSPIHTHDTTGIIHVEADVVFPFTLGHVFDSWGLQFTSQCIGGYCASGPQTLKVYVNGMLLTGNPRDLMLASHQEIAIIFGTDQQMPNPIPSTYNFGGGL